MGNRGDLHADDGTLGRRKWRTKRWISCTLDPGRSLGVPFDSPGHYYPLFFHDEAVALAAGHRPCAQCRRDAFGSFIAAWSIAHGAATISEIDHALHGDRIDGRTQRTRKGVLRELPAGTFLTLPNGDFPMLLWGGSLHPWSHSGYGASIELRPDTSVNVLTPKALVEALKAGFRIKPALGEQIPQIDGKRISDPDHHKQRGISATALNPSQI